LCEHTGDALCELGRTGVNRVRLNVECGRGRDAERLGDVLPFVFGQSRAVSGIEIDGHDRVFGIDAEPMVVRESYQVWLIRFRSVAGVCDPGAAL